MGTINLSVAVWVGFLALFGIATDNGVIVCTYLQQVFKEKSPVTINAIRAAAVETGDRRVRPAMVTSTTTILTLLPALTSNGRGADVLVLMAIPIFGGMMLAILTIFIVPVFYCGLAEISDIEIKERHNRNTALILCYSPGKQTDYFENFVVNSCDKH